MEKKIRILITGSRDIPENRKAEVWVAIISQATELYGNGEDQAILIEGGCPTGADRYARDFVLALKQSPIKDTLPLEFHLETHLANWNEHGKMAGSIRNREMVQSGADVCLAFYQTGAGNRGTSGCVMEAEKAGIPVVIAKGFEK